MIHFINPRPRVTSDVAVATPENPPGLVQRDIVLWFRLHRYLHPSLFWVFRLALQRSCHLSAFTDHHLPVLIYLIWKNLLDEDILHVAFISLSSPLTQLFYLSL